MRLVLTLLCRNEADILPSLLDFHLSRGVDHVIATDNGSDDGTTELLENCRRRGCLTLLHERDHIHDQAVWVTRMARLAATGFGADWVINTDADEFWWPSGDSLKKVLTALPSHVNALAVSRSNFVPVAHENGPFHARMGVRETASFTHLGHPLPPKVCHRGDPDICVADGNHSIYKFGARVSLTVTGCIEILHFPLRSYAQFERKIREGAEALERNPRLRETSIGATWLYVYRNYYCQSRLADYYAGQCLSEAAVREGLIAGRLVRDWRLQHALAGAQNTVRTEEAEGAYNASGARTEDDA